MKKKTIQSEFTGLEKQIARIKKINAKTNIKDSSEPKKTYHENAMESFTCEFCGRIVELGNMEPGTYYDEHCCRNYSDDCCPYCESHICVDHQRSIEYN